MKKPSIIWTVYRQRWTAGEFPMECGPWEKVCTVRAVSEAQAIARAQFKYGLQRDPVDFAGAEHGVNYRAEAGQE